MYIISFFIYSMLNINKHTCSLSRYVKYVCVSKKTLVHNKSAPSGLKQQKKTARPCPSLLTIICCANYTLKNERILRHKVHREHVPGVLNMRTRRSTIVMSECTEFADRLLNNWNCLEMKMSTQLHGKASYKYLELHTHTRSARDQKKKSIKHPSSCTEYILYTV